MASGRAVRLCESVCVQVGAITPGKVYVGHWEGYSGCFVFLFCFCFEGRGGGGETKRKMTSQAADVSPLVWL